MNLPATPPVDFRNLAALEPARIEGDVSRAIVVRKKPGGKAFKVGTAGALGLATATGVLAWRAAAMRRRTRNAELLIAGAAGIGLIGLGLWQLQRLFAPQPKYDVELRDAARDFEVRIYPALKTAATEVDATWDQALDEGFGRLARFIFGANANHTKLPMFAPVLGTGDKFGYRLSFVLPDQADLPRPEDARIQLRDIPARKVGVVRFRGRYNAYNLAVHKKDLAHALAVHHMKPRGEAVFAGYDPPSTLPLLRRNELWVELA